MTGDLRMSARQALGLLGGSAASLAAMAVVHTAYVVPAILGAAEVRAQAIMDRHLTDVEDLRKQYVTQDQLALILRDLDSLHLQLNRIEDKLK